MSLPSLVDVFTVIVLIIPGFVSFVLFKHITIVEKKFSDFERIVWSLLMSLLIYAVFSFFTGINSIDTIRDAILLPINLVSILGLSLIFGVIPGGITKYVLRKRVRRGDCWDVCMSRVDQKKKYWVLVNTELGEEVKGRIHVYGTEGEHKREIVIEEPKLIIRDKKRNIIDEIEIGSEILFLQKDIRRITFLESLREEKPKDETK